MPRNQESKQEMNKYTNMSYIEHMLAKAISVGTWAQFLRLRGRVLDSSYVGLPSALKCVIFVQLRPVRGHVQRMSFDRIDRMAAELSKRLVRWSVCGK